MRVCAATRDGVLLDRVGSSDSFPEHRRRLPTIPRSSRHFRHLRGSQVCPNDVRLRISGPHADRARRTGSVERRKPASGRLHRTTPRESTMKSAFRGLPAPTFTVLSYSMHRIADASLGHRETESVCQPSGTDSPRKPWHMIHRWISFCGEPRVAPTQSIDFPIVFEPLRNIHSTIPHLSSFARDIRPPTPNMQLSEHAVRSLVTRSSPKLASELEMSVAKRVPNFVSLSPSTANWRRAPFKRDIHVFP